MNIFPCHLQFDADVVGCIRDPSDDSVTALDTWNDLPNTRNNIRDNIQDVTLFNSSFENGTISCTWVYMCVFISEWEVPMAATYST